MKKEIKVNILTSGRSHVLDLARELDKDGFDVMFYSFVPSWMAMKYGLPDRCISSIFWILAPLGFFERRICSKQKKIGNLRRVFQDILTTIWMRKADITIAMSGNFQRAIDKAKKRGDLIVVERGSKHVLEQKRILESIPANIGRTIVDKRTIKRELHDYEMADYVSVASEHVKRSFLAHGFPQGKIFVNPYGVDVSQFRPSSDKDKKYDLLMVGNWCYRKGCDLIVEAVQKENLKFLHVGTISDMHFPQDENFVHVDAVPQETLLYYYHQAKIFVLPSREDGFGMVLSQALACNLPIVGSPDCGAPDLKKLIVKPEYISIIKDYSVGSLINAIKETLLSYEKLGDTVYAGDASRELTWEAYGKRYADFLNKIVTS